MCVCVCVCTCGGQRVLNPLGLGLKVVMSHLMRVFGTELRSSRRATRALYH